MADKLVKTFKEGLRVGPVSADPANPQVGQQQESDGTHRAEGLWRYDGSDWVRLGGSGGIISDVIDYTPTLSDNTNNNSVGKYRRVGGSAEISVRVNWTGNGAGTTFSVSLPPGLSIDTSKIPTTANLIGNAWWFNSNTSPTVRDLVPRAFTSTEISFAESDTSNTWDGSQAEASDHIDLLVTVPIVGWETGVLPNEISEGKLHTVEAEGNAGEVITAAVTNIPFSTILQNGSASWSGTEFTAPETGTYDFNGGVLLTTVQLDAVDAYVDTGSGYTLARRAGSASDADSTQHLNVTLNLNQGDKVAFRLAVGGTLSNNPNFHFLNIRKVVNLSSQITPAETVAARYKTDSGQSIPFNTTTTVIFEDIDYNTNGSNYNTTTGVYTVPVSGKYMVNCGFYYTPTPKNAGERALSIITVDGVNQSFSSIQSVNPTGNVEYFVGHADVLDLVSGQEVTIRTTHNFNSTSASLSTAVDGNFFSITKVGN